MRAVAKIDEGQIENMSLDITIRMTVDEWRQLVSNMRQGGAWPDRYLGRYIEACLNHVKSATSVTFTDPMHEADKP